MEAVRHLKEQRIVSCLFVFATQTGKYLSYRNLQATMEKACEAAGVEQRGIMHSDIRLPATCTPGAW